MYIPKVLADNNWALRWNVWVWGDIPQLWHVFITFWFSLFGEIKLRLAPETFAVTMNFLSWMLVLFFGIALIKEIIEYFWEKNTNIKVNEDIKGISFASWWTILLLWLSSGMWAFLVFVDNKTDLGVMAMTTLAILSGIIFIRYIAEHKNKEDKKDSLKYLIVSGLFFGLASMSKQTAFLDISIFGVLLLWLWMNAITSIWAGISLIGLMWILQPWNAKDFLDPLTWKYILGIWLVIFMIWIIQFIFNKKLDKKEVIRNILIWVLAIFMTLFIFKWPAIIYKQYIDWDINISKWAKWLLFSKVEIDNERLYVANDINSLENQNQIDQQVMNVYNNSLNYEQCLKTEFTEKDLSWWVRKAEAWNEDVWRYVWYWWKEFTKPSGWVKIWYYIMKAFWWWDNKCYWVYKDAKILCDNKIAIEIFNTSALKSVLSTMDKDSKWYQLLSDALNDTKLKNNSGYVSANDARDHILKLKKYYQDNTIRSESGKLSVPYRYVVPLNIVFNRSLQNLSSYYTDIWFIWMFIFIFLIVWFFYSLNTRDKNLISIMTASIIWWGIWWIIWWWILRYWLWLIIRTTLSIIIFIHRLYSESKKDNDRIMFFVMLFILWVWVILQLFFNWIRISSQWAWWPFARYKSNVWMVTEFDELLQQKEIIKYNYNWKDVFDLQFGHYNKFIDFTANRQDKDWVLIAWTYLPYFLDNQKNILNDGMLSWLWEKTSDNDSCKSYKRLQKDNIKYLVIDPNIATVVMWEWNESLFNRFFSKRDVESWKIKDHWSLTMLSKMYQEWFIKLYYSNNLWAKYAFSLTDEELKSLFPNESDIVYLRAKMSVARFFPDANDIINTIATIFNDRIINWSWIWDLADVFGKTINEKNVVDVASMLLENPSSYEQIETIKQKTNIFTQDERFVLAQYLWLYRALVAGDQQYQWFLQNIISQSLAGGSQLIIFELK